VIVLDFDAIHQCNVIQSDYVRFENDMILQMCLKITRNTIEGVIFLRHRKFLACAIKNNGFSSAQSRVEKTCLWWRERGAKS